MQSGPCRCSNLYPAGSKNPSGQPAFTCDFPPSNGACFPFVAVASFLSVLINYMSRIIDRPRAINAISDEDIEKAHLKAALPQLHIPATIVNRAIFTRLVAASSPAFS
jgi:hypothetical protein